MTTAQVSIANRGEHVETLIQSLINGALLGCIYTLIALGLSIIFGVMNVVNSRRRVRHDLDVHDLCRRRLLGHGCRGNAHHHIPVALCVRWRGVLPAHRSNATQSLRHADRCDRRFGGAFAFGRSDDLARPATLAAIFHRAGELGHWRDHDPRFAGLRRAGEYRGDLPGLPLSLMKTWPGRAIRAASDDLDAASLMGVNYKRTYALTFGLGATLTALAGGAVDDLPTGRSVDGSALRAAELVRARPCGARFRAGNPHLRNHRGRRRGVGSHLLGPGPRLLAVYLIFILVLWLRPRGLFGRK